MKIWFNICVRSLSSAGAEISLQFTEATVVMGGTVGVLLSCTLPILIHLTFSFI